jgi:hypothetical protein
VISKGHGTSAFIHGWVERRAFFRARPALCGFAYSQWGYFEYSHGRARAELGRQVERAQQRLVALGLGCGHGPTPSTYSGGARWGFFKYSITLGDSEYSHARVLRVPTADR